MEWLFFAALSTLFWSLNSVLSKVLIDKRFDKPLPFVILLILVDFVFMAVIGLIFPISHVLPYSAYVIAIGMFVVCSFWFFYHAMRQEEGSRVVSLTQTAPLMTAVLSALLLGEVLVARQYVGIVLLVASSIIVSHKKTESGRKMSAALKYAIVFALAVALYDVATKYMLQYIDYWSFFFWSTLGMVLDVPLLLLVPSVRADFRRMLSMMDRKTLAACALNESLWFLGNVCLLVAISIGFVSLVSAVGALQPLFVLVIASMLSVFTPKLLKEDIGRGHLLEKLSAALMIFVGIWLISMA